MKKRDGEKRIEWGKRTMARQRKKTESESERWRKKMFNYKKEEGRERVIGRKQIDRKEFEGQLT